MRKSLLLSLVALGAAASSAFAADLPTQKGPPPAPTIVMAPYSWAGFYVGVNGGYADPTAKLSVSSPNGVWSGDNDWGPSLYGPGIAAVGTASIGLHGFIGGAQAGYNYQINNFVLGVESDADYMNLNGSYATPKYYDHNDGPGQYWANGSARVDSLFTLRLRAGLAFDRLLVFATGGLAVTDEKFSQSIGYYNPSNNIQLPITGNANGYNAGSASTTTVTGVIGGGVEYAFDKNWSIKGEYLYVPLKSLGFTSVSTVDSTYVMNHHESLSALNVFRIGLNYRFQ